MRGMGYVSTSRIVVLVLVLCEVLLVEIELLVELVLVDIVVEREVEVLWLVVLVE